MNIGKAIRLKGLFRHNDSRLILVPMDHGITKGPIKGIVDIEQTIEVLSDLPIDGIVLHKGIISSCHKAIIKSGLPLIMHLSASTSLGDQDTKVLVGNVKEAVSFGCSAVSLHLNFGVTNESAMLRDMAIISKDCYKFGMPLLAMAYHKKCNSDTIGHISRVCAELGADLVKIPYTKEGGDFSKVVSGCPIPILISGGEKDNNILETVTTAIESGASGVAIGRSIFQSDNIHNIIKKISSVVRNR